MQADSTYHMYTMLVAGSKTKRVLKIGKKIRRKISKAKARASYQTNNKA